VTTAGLMFVRLTLTGRLGAILGEGVLSAENGAALAPELLCRCGEARSARRRSPTITTGAASASTAAECNGPDRREAPEHD
jgi:hypothetical protein